MTGTVVPNVVSQDEWTKARKDLLQKERDMTHAMDELAKARRDLPAVKIGKEYKFTDLEGKEVALSELFGQNKQLIVYHLMFGPEAEKSCTGCATICDGFGDTYRHLSQRSTAFAAIARGKPDSLSSFAEKMGWKFPIYTTHGTGSEDFVLDFNALSDSSRKPVFHNYMTESELNEKGLGFLAKGDQPGISVFLKDDEGVVYHTYSTYARGLDNVSMVYRLLDLTPMGRQEKKGENIGFFPFED